MLRLKCTTSGPELALAVSRVTSAVYLPTHPGSSRAYYFKLSTAQTLCACYFHQVMHLETEHLADTPLLGLGQQGCPHKTLSHLTSPGLTKPLKRTTTISSQRKRMRKSM